MNHRDLELLSAYLDGRLSAGESARVETRLQSDREMQAALAELRAIRGLLRQFPQRKAPRNFTLTRQMAGANPPLPRSYSFFQLASALASLLLALSFAANALAPRLTYVGPMNYGMGGGSGGGYGGMGGGPALAQPAPQEPALEAPAMELAPQATAMPEDSARVAPAAETPMAKTAGGNPPEAQSQPTVEKAAPFSLVWQMAFLIIAALGAVGAFLQREAAKRKWR